MQYVEKQPLIGLRFCKSPFNLNRLNIKDSIERRLAIGCLEVKPGTQLYYQGIAKIILKLWPDLSQDTAAITENHLIAFLPLVAHYSAPRFNAIVSALKDTIPAAGFLKWRPVKVKERANLSQLQFNTLLRELDQRPKSHAGLIIRFLAHTGLRINEARRLRWADVHLDFILVPGSITKNGKPRHVPFVNGIEATLSRLKAISAGDFILPADVANRSLKTACKFAGVPPLAHHDFRHMFATRCIESGVDIPTVARWLGHQDGGALLGRVYFHLADGHSREMAGRVKI